MPQPRLARVGCGVAALIVLVSLPAAGSATAASSRPTSRSNRGTSVAERALATVEAAFGQSVPDGLARGAKPAPTGEITLALRDLRAHLGSLSGADRRVAQSYLARPTSSASVLATTARSARATSDCKQKPHLAAVVNSHFCIHYDRSGKNAPSLADKDHNGLPDQVDKTRTVMNHVWDAIVTQGGYHSPPSDGNEGGTLNGQSRFDVYLRQIGNQGLYGYCAPERAVHTQFSTHAATSYCVLDNDYREFPHHTHLQNLKVTGAHEFFHSVQFAYDYNDDTYFLENTATWVEDQIYTNINDNRQFLVSSSKDNPNRPLNSGAARYGNWIWWRYLTEHFPDQGSSDLPLLVRHTWENAITMSSLNALATTLDDLGTSIPQQLSGFGVASRHPAAAPPLGFTEGSAYSAAPLSATANFIAAPSSTGSQSLSLNHLANGTVRFVPNASDNDFTWHLTINVGSPSRPSSPYAMVTVVPTSGQPTTQSIPLAGDGTGRATVSFNSSTVAGVELTLTNGSRSGSAAKFSFSATSSSS